MKKLTYILAVIIGLLNVTIFAQGFASPNFIGGGDSDAYNGYLQVTATSTNTIGTTNIYAQGVIQTNSATYPYVSGYAPLFKTNTSWSSAVTLWSDRDGTPPNANISVQMSGLNASFTNIGLFKFASVPRGTAYSTAAQNMFQFSVTGQGTTNVIVSTNFPTVWMQGCKSIVLQSIEWSNAGTNGTVVGVWLNGYKPVLNN